MYMSNCKTAQRNGIKVLHGNRGVYHNEKQPAFKAVYEAIRDHDIEKQNLQQLVARIDRNIAPSSSSKCKEIAPLFTADMKKRIQAK